jgi:MerR family transcriptional regulator/heat shock protein HspR
MMRNTPQQQGSSGADEPLYTISIAARLVRPDKPEEPIHPQTLRMYEKLGLVTPRRIGKNRLYSNRDIERLRRIQSYTNLGVNLAGVEVILTLLERMDTMQRQMDEHREAMRRELEQRLAEMSAAVRR